MSRVFLATERKLNRRVVIKVLSGDLAASLSTERFAREIQLAASLQQANIVPVLSSGTAGDVPWFSMPYVEGESLRVRLTRGPLSEAEAVSVLRDVARALVYAHERGVVHRDIKPDNVLLSGESAVVTDFGIAKAISASRTGEFSVAGATITQAGMSIGTPTYMAPEQAAGDPSTDHRADLYALGCMAFELLAGRPPFAATSVHALLRAHLAETPPRLRSVKPDASPALDALVARLLEKSPAARPATARDVLAQLDAATHSTTGTRAATAERSLVSALARWAAAFIATYVLARAAEVGIGLPSWTVPLATIVAALGLPAVLFTWYVKRTASKALATAPLVTPGGTATYGPMATMALKATPYVSWRRTRLLGVVAAGAVVSLLVIVLVLRQFGIGPAASLLASGRVKADSRILVAEFVSSGADTSLGSVLSQAMRTSLSQSGAVKVVPLTDVAASLRRMLKPVSTHLTDAVAREVAQRDGIPLVITGQIASVGSGFLISANIVSADSGTVLATMQRAANGADDMLSAIDKVARDVRTRLGESLRSVARAPSLASVSTTSLEALKEYTRAIQLGDVQGVFKEAVPLLQHAIALDSNFAEAWRKYSAYGRNARVPLSVSFTAARRAYQLRDRLTGAERAEVEAYYLRSTDLRRSIEYYLATPDISLNNAGLALLERGEYARADTVLAEQMRRDSVAGQSVVAQVMDNRAYAKLFLGDTAGARALFERRRAATPGGFTNERNDFYLHAWNQGLDSIASRAARLQRSTAPLSRQFGSYQLTAAAGASGQLREMAARAALLSARNDSLQSDLSYLGVPVWMAVTRGVLAGEESRSVTRLDSIAAARERKSPGAMESTAPQLAQAYAQLGRADRAKALLEPWKRALQPDERLARWGELYLAEGEVALAQGQATAALSQFRRAAAGDSGVTVSDWSDRAQLALARAHDKAGNADSAVRWYERVATGRGDADVLAPGFPVALRRLGELYEARGDTIKALERYRAFVKLWANADPELQPQVTDIKQRIAQLDAALARKR